MWRCVDWSFFRANCIPSLHTIRHCLATCKAPIFPLARSSISLARAFTLTYTTHSSGIVLKMELARSSEMFLTMPVYTASLVTSSVPPWGLQARSTSVDLLTVIPQAYGPRRTLTSWFHLRCTLRTCNVQGTISCTIPVVWDMTPCQSVVTDVSVELAPYSGFR